MANTKISALTSATTPLTGSEIVPVNQSGVTDSVTVANLTAGRNTNVAKLMVNNTGLTPVVGVDIYSDSGRVNAPLPFNTIREWPIWTASQRYDGSFDRGIVGIYIYSANGFGQDGALRFKTSANDIAAVTALEISNAQNVTFNVGNLVQGTAGKGINFTANTPASGMTSQNLTWYEEGTISATVTAGSGSGYTTAVYFAKYTRVGRLVTVGFNVQVTAAGTASGAMTISGLPFTSTSTIIPSCSVYEQVSGTMYMARVPAGGTTVVVTTTLGLGVNWAYGTQYNIFLTYEV